MAGLGRDLAESDQETIDLIHGVVVDEADSEKSARLLDIEMLGEIQGVVVAVPGKEAEVAEFSGQFEWRVAFDSHG